MAHTQQDGVQDGDRYNGKAWYSPNVLRSITLGLADMFNDIVVRRFEKDFITVVKEINVPLHVAPKTKEYFERKEDYTSEGGKRYYQQAPALALVFTGMNYAQQRVMAPNEERAWPYPVDASVDPDYFKDYSPTPYDLTYELKIRTESMEDYIQIIEQIIPFFNPSLTLRMREIPFLDVARNVRVNLDSPSIEIPQELTGSDMNQIEGTLSLTCEAFLYRPITNAIFLKELYKYISAIETDGDKSFDRRIRTLMAFNEADIPQEAVNKRKTLYGYWLYELLDQVNDIGA